LRPTAPPHASSSRSRASPYTPPSRSWPTSSERSTSSRGATDPLAILLGAASLDEALTGLDSLSRAAGENNRIIEQARSSRLRLAALDARLAAREAELVQLAAAATDRARALEQAVGTRKSFVAGLRQQQGLNAARIASIEVGRAARRRGPWRSRPVPLLSRPPSSTQHRRQRHLSRRAG
jgi:hypothetical protein